MWNDFCKIRLSNKILNMFRMEELRQFYRFRPDEVFRRVTVTSLVGLMIEVSKLEFQVFIRPLDI